MIGATSLAAAFILDLIVGDPRCLPHPVVMIGKYITLLEKGLRRLFPATPRAEYLASLLLVIAVCIPAFALPFALLAFAAMLNPWLAFALNILLCAQLLATKSLRDAAMTVYAALAANNIPKAREAVSHIVGRDTQSLDAPEITRATVETVAENASDGVIAPMLYMAIGGLPLSMLYKAVNTMDSMLGYKNEKYLYFGRAAARLDDAANFLPARLTALLLCAAAFLLRLDGKNAWRIYRRDRTKHTSPNAGHPEAACAGALGVMLGGPSSYGGTLSNKPHIGDAITPLAPDAVIRSCRLLYCAAALGLAVCLIPAALAACIFGAMPWI